MAIYSIRTTRQQEVGLQFSYDQFADKLEFPTKEAYFQSRIDLLVTNPMYQEQQRAQLTSFEASFETVPEAEQPVARTEIEGVITAHGGTIVPVGPLTPNPNIPRGMLPTTRGTTNNPIQIGGGIKEDADSGRRDGEGDN